MLCTTESKYSAMVVIADADLETRGAANWAAEDCGVTYLEVISGISYTLTVKIYIDVCNIRTCMYMKIWSWAAYTKFI